MNVVESICDTVVPTVSSDQDMSATSVSENDNAVSNDSDDQYSPSASGKEDISFSMFFNKSCIFTSYCIG
jgi:hypothetical protein